MKTICLYPVIPVRKEPSDRSEMVTQLLYGESCEILENHPKNNFIKIKQDFDGYEGWVDQKQIGKTEKDHHTIITDRNHYLKQAILPLGALSSGINHNDQLNLKNISEVAKKFLHTAYLWGGKSNFGIDCSGLTQQVYKMCGVRILRDAYQQAQQGTEIPFDRAEKGDLAFFGKEKITHVGIVLDRGEIIHAHGFVRINKFNRKGILSDDSTEYTHEFKGCRKYI